MLFSFKHVILPAIGALVLLQSTIARPLLLVEKNGLTERGSSIEGRLIHGEFNVELVDPRDDLGQHSIFDRHLLDRRARRGGTGETNGLQGSNAHSVVQKDKPHSRLTLGPEFKAELDKINLHGKVRTNTISWHKKHVKEQMKTHPLLRGKAGSAVLQHVVHKGGSDPKEKNHITASFKDHKGKQIRPDFKPKRPVESKILRYRDGKPIHPLKKGINGGKDHEPKNFHLYGKSNNGLPRQAKAALNENNAEIKAQPESHQKSLGKTRSPGKSSGKGKGKNNPERSYSKNPKKEHRLI